MTLTLGTAPSLLNEGGGLETPAFEPGTSHMKISGFLLHADKTMGKVVLLSVKTAAEAVKIQTEASSIISMWDEECDKR